MLQTLNVLQVAAPVTAWISGKRKKVKIINDQLAMQKRKQYSVDSIQ